MTALAAAPAQSAVDNHISLVSVASPEVFPGANGSFTRAISNDGQYVLFASEQPNIVPAEPGDLGRYVYLRNVSAGTTTRLSHGTEGYLMGNAAISGDGRFSVFPNNETAEGETKLRLYNRVTGKTTVISQAPLAGTTGLDWFTVGISDNGRKVVYTRTSTSDDSTWTTRMYSYDTQTKVTTPLGPASLGGPQDRPNYATVPSVSSTGRYVVYLEATDPTSSESTYKLVRLDTTNGSRIVVATSDPQYIPVNAFGEPAVSNTGRFITYAPLGASGVPDAYIYDATKGTSTLVSHDANGDPASNGASNVQISGNGRYVAYAARSTTIVVGTPNVGNIYVWDRVTDTTEAIVVNRQGVYPGGSGAGSALPYIDGDGSTVAFTSTAQNLTPGASTRLERVYVWQRP